MAEPVVETNVIHHNTDAAALRAPLRHEFYEHGAIEVARSLLNRILIVSGEAGIMNGRITETEAYLPDDPASHAFRGRTPRNAPMFGSAGHAYVYFTYGMHYCFNVVTGGEGTGEAVLIRALEPLVGLEQMALNRSLTEPAATMNCHRLGRALCGGPARLCQALGLGRADNGIDLTIGDRAWIADTGAEKHAWNMIVASTRIGISVGVDSPWRFTLRDDPFTSRPVK